MGHGSQELYTTHWSSLNVPKAAQALRMAFTSAWAVGSLSRVTEFTPVAMSAVKHYHCTERPSSFADIDFGQLGRHVHEHFIDSCQGIEFIHK